MGAVSATGHIVGAQLRQLLCKATSGGADLDPLYTPAELGELKLKNRYVLASLTRARAGPSRVPNDLMVEHYRIRAAHYGLLLTEATGVSPYGEGWWGTPSIYTEEQTAGWKRVVDLVHQEGGLIVCQMWFMGRAGHTSFMPEGEKNTWSASDLPVTLGVVGKMIYTAAGQKVPPETPRAMTLDEIHQVIESFGKATENCKAAGFDGVELHCANGYLVDQFLQSVSNVRTDQYGGSLENRTRFMRDILDRMLKVYPSGRIGVKLSPNGVYGGMGSPDNHELYRYVLEMLNPYNLAYVQVMDTVLFGHHGKCSPMGLEDFRPVYQGNLMANCGYTPAMASRRVASGHANVVSFGRPTLSNPDYPTRVRNGWPIASDLSQKLWYGTANKAPEEGYADQLPYTP